MADKDHAHMGTRETAPLHRPNAHIDAGTPDTGDGGTIVNPPSNTHPVTPEVGKNIPTGQVTKM